MSTDGLTRKDICDLRLKCLEMFVTVGAKTNIEQDVVFEKAKKAFDFVAETPKPSLQQTTRQGPDARRP